MTQVNKPQEGYIPSSSPWRVYVSWGLALLAVVFLVWLFRELGSRVRPASAFSPILRVQDGWIYALLGLVGAGGVLALTSYVGKVQGERARGRTVNYWAVFGDQLTHLVIWLIIVFALYPIVFIIGASLDPLNRLLQATLGRAEEAFIFRARILPPLEGTSWSNYTALFDGVRIYAWQWALVILGFASLIWLGLVNLRARAYSGGRPPLSLIREQQWASRLLVAAIVGFFAFLLPGQFTGSSNASKFLLWIRNTFLVSGITGIMAIILTTTAGYAMARLRFPGRFQMLLFFIFVQMFPVIVGLVAIFSIVKSLDLLNTFTGLILAYSGGAIAFGTWIYKGYVESLPASLEEAALVDGTTRWGAFTKIVLPLSGPMLVFIFLLQFIGTYAEFILANVLLSGAANWNVGVGLRSFNPGSNAANFYGQFAAAAVLGAIPIVALFYGFQQVFVSGTVAGGVKE